LEDDVVPGASGSSGQVQAQAVQANQEVIDALRAEIAGIRTKAEEEVKGVRDELKEKLKAVGEAEIGRAKAEARAGMLQGQSRLMRI
jgi:F0F1-type ATP synthase membrane subunit b/b'